MLWTTENLDTVQNRQQRCNLLVTLAFRRRYDEPLLREPGASS